MPTTIAGKSMSNGDMLLGGGLIVGLVSAFLPWHTTTYPASYYYGGVSDSRNAFGYWSGWLFFLLFLAGLALFAVRNFIPSVKLPALPITDAMIYLGIGVVMLLSALLWLATGGDYGALQAALNATGFSSGISFGWIIGLLAAIAVGAAGYLKKDDPQPETKPIASYQVPSSPAPPPMPG